MKGNGFCEPMICEECRKRLSKKSVRIIGGRVICSACLFPKMKGGVLLEGKDT